MKKLVLITWLLITLATPYINDFATASQLGQAFCIWCLWYFNKVLNKEQFNFILCTFGIYYTWIYISDQFITYMPDYVIILESLLFFVILLVNVEDD